jgi:hypothetical protein
MVVNKTVKRKQPNLTKIIFQRETDLEIIISSDPSSRPSRKITTANIEQTMERINVEKLCKSMIELSQRAVGDIFTIHGTKIKIRNKYNQYKPTDTQMDLCLNIFC